MIHVSRYLLDEEDRLLIANALSYGYVLDDPPRCIPSAWLSAREDDAVWYEQLRVAFLGRKTTALGGLNLVSLGFDAQQLSRLAHTLLCIKTAMHDLPDGAAEMGESRRRDCDRATAAIDAALGVIGLIPNDLNFGPEEV